jgi:hypothetical protein
VSCAMCESRPCPGSHSLGEILTEIACGIDLGDGSDSTSRARLLDLLEMAFQEGGRTGAIDPKDAIWRRSP